MGNHLEYHYIRLAIISIQKRKNVELRGLGTYLCTISLRTTNPLIARSFLKVSIVRQLHGKELRLLWAETFNLNKKYSASEIATVGKNLNVFSIDFV